MTSDRIEPAIRGLIQAKNFAAVHETFKEWPPADLSELITGLPDDERVIVFRLLPHQRATETFAYLSVEAQHALLRAMGHEEVAKVVNGMSPDDRTTLLEELLWGSLSGSMLPFLLRKCGLDPATSSAPFVATLVDVTGLVIYFTVALVLLRGTVL